MISVPHFPLVIPIEKRNIIWKSVTRVGTIPKRVKKAFTRAAGTPVSTWPSSPIPGARMLTLTGSSMHQVRRHVLEAMPAVGGMHHPGILLRAKHLGGSILEGDLEAGFRIRDRFRVPRLEEPVVLLLKPPADAPDCLPEIDSLADHLLR